MDKDQQLEYELQQIWTMFIILFIISRPHTLYFNAANTHKWRVDR